MAEHRHTVYVSHHAQERWAERGSAQGSAYANVEDIITYWSEACFQVPFHMVYRAMRLKHRNFKAQETHDYYWDGAELLFALTKGQRGEQRTMKTIIKLNAAQAACLEPARPKDDP